MSDEFCVFFCGQCLQSIIRVVFHDRRLQYTEHQQLEGWRWNRPGDRILDLGEYGYPRLMEKLRLSSD